MDIPRRTQLKNTDDGHLKAGAKIQGKRVQTTSQIEKLKKENDKLKEEMRRLEERLEGLYLVTVMNRIKIAVLVKVLEKIDVVDNEKFRELCKKKYRELVEKMEWRAIKTYNDLRWH